MRHVTAERWRRMEELLDQALELPTGERRALLDEQCRGDAELRADLEALLQADALATGFLDDSADSYAALLLQDEDTDESSSGASPGDLIGAYRILHLLAQGGMGAVYLAERADGQFEQRVALKLVRRGLNTEEVHRRFIAERQILARLNHPHIARLLDGGRTASGQPWFVMEYVEGETLTGWCDARQLALTRRLELFEQVCEAVRYAHQNLVVHRDLKPSNILVTADGTVKLLDFGIAKLLHTEPEIETTRTEFGVRAMTPEYAAPEQIRGEPVTTAVDVYALGAVLYELLSGHRAHRFAHRSAAEVERVVCELPPLPPSAVLLTSGERGRGGVGSEPLTPERVSAGRGATPSRLHHLLRGDLDTIALTALRKEPERRYGSVEALLEDVRRHRAGLPIQAHRDTFAYRARKFVRRNRVAVAAGTLLALALGTGVVATAWQARVAARQAARATAVKDFVIGLFQGSRPEATLGRPVTVRELLDAGASKVDTALADQPEVRAELLATLASIHMSIGDYPRSDSLYARAAAEWERIAGDRDRPELLTTVTGWAKLQMEQGDFVAAESTLTRAHGMSLRMYGETDTTTLNIISGMAGLARRRDKRDVADSLHRYVLSAVRRQLGEDHLETARAITNYAVILTETGEPERADTLYQQALAIRRRHQHGDHPDVLLIENNRGTLLRELGRYEEAEALLRDVFERRRRVQGDEHPELAWTMTSLARVRQARGALSEAESLLAAAMRIKRRTYPPDSPELAPELNNLAILNFQMERYDSAVALIHEALAIWQRTLGPEGGYTVTATNNLGTMLSLSGRYAEAEPLLRDALATRRRLFGDEHESVGLSLRNLGVLLHRTGRLAEAERTLRDAAKNLRAARGADHPGVLNAELSLGELLVDRAKPGEAEPLLRHVLEGRLALLGPDHAATAEAQRALAACLTARRQFTEAERLLVASERVLAQDPYKRLELAKTRGALEALYRAWGTGRKRR
ncbi:MAG TPA: serine/threonine-protein kinase [Gemmatimonadaceae bacterium]|nr:serine/threonine-protein kinase [Gemmatimonadaceae bacterium]